VEARRAAIILVGLTVILLAHLTDVVRSQTPAAPVTYAITDLGTLGLESQATDIDDSGQVVGYSRTSAGAVRAFSYRDGVMTDLGTFGGTHSRAFALNYLGAVVGEAQDAAGRYQAFLRASGSLTNLGTLGGTTSRANGVNGARDVVGSATTAGNAATRAFLYRNGVMATVGGTFGGTHSVAEAINDAGEIVGYASTTNNASTRAFRFSNGVMTNLGTLGGASEAKDVNELGDVVGHSRLADNNTQHAFIYTGGHLVDIGTLGGTRSSATRISDFGEVVGWSQVAGDAEQHAFMWRNGVMTDLNDTIPAGSGWTLHTASGINSAGQIVGFGTKNGATRAFLLTPPQDLFLYPFGMFGSVGNLPRPVQAGRTVRYYMSMYVNEDGVRPSANQTVTVTDTVSGPVEIVSAGVSGGPSCNITGLTVTCRVPNVGWGSTQEVSILVRTTAAGVFSHTARITAPSTDPNPEDNVIREENTAISLSSLTLTPSTLAGGKASSARMTLTHPHVNGATVRLASSNPTVLPLPPSFVVTNLSRALNIFPKVVSVPTPVTVSATYGLVTKTATLTVMPPVLTMFSLSPTTVIGGCGTTSAKVSLTGSAPANGAPVVITESLAAAGFPSSIVLAAGTMTRTLSIPTSYVTKSQVGPVGASYGGVSKAVTMTVRPIRARTLVLSPNPVMGGKAVTAAVTLECAAPTPTVVTLSSSNSALAAPTTSTLTIPAGALTGTFGVRTADVSTLSTVSIRAAVYGVVTGTALTLNP
jgi:probable HAF family extracellular repeat protein